MALTKNRIKYVNSLRQKKNRQAQGLFIAEGLKMVKEILSSRIKVRTIYAGPAFQIPVLNYPVEVIRIQESEMKRISSLATSSEALAVCAIPEYDLEIVLLQNKLSLVLDTLHDPGNMGTLIRIADWFGLENIICSNDTVDAYNPKVIQATMGSIARVKVHYAELEKFLGDIRRHAPDIRIFGTVLDGENVYQKKISASEGLIVMGNESHGISEPVIQHITDKISIPCFGAAESLNVAIAAAVICSEFRRR